MGRLADARAAATRARNTTTRESFNRTKRNLKRTAQLFTKGTRSRLSGVAAYAWRSIRNSIKAGGKRLQKGHELAIWTPTGQRLCTVQEFLAGAYRAIGHGSRTVKAWHTHNKTLVAGRLAARNQRKGVYIKQGTGRFDDKTRETIHKIRHRAATQAAIRREIAWRQKRQEHYKRQSRFKSWTEEQRAKAANEAAVQAKLIGKLRRQGKKLDTLELKKKIRIVARDRHDVQARDVQTHFRYHPGSRPGNPPKTWGAGKVLKKAIYFQTEGDTYYIFAAPRDGAAIYQILEFGGQSMTGRRDKLGRERGNLIGYVIESEREKSASGRQFSHKRVSLRRKYEPRRPIRIEPRPFFTPAIPKIKARVAELFGPDFAAKVATGIERR